MGVLKPILNSSSSSSGGSGDISTITITSDTTLNQYYNRVEIDGSGGSPITVTLPDNTAPFIDKAPIYFERIDDFTNVNNVVKIVAQTASKLKEVGQEIILDLSLGVEVFLDSNDDYRSTNSFSEKRRQKLQNMSTSLTIDGYDKDNYITVDTTSQAWDTAEILQGGEGWIIDRTSNDFDPDVYKVSWDPTSGIDTSPTNQDGNFIIHVNTTGVITMESIDERSLLPVYSASGANANTNLQIGQFARSGGTATGAAQAIQGLVNSPLAIDQILQSFGTLNSAANPLGVEANGANLNVNFTAGEGIGTLLGWTGDAGGLSRNLNILSADISAVTIILVTRDNVIQGSGTTVNVDQYEDPNNPGTLITMANNTSKLNFYRGFPDDGFITECLGQATYATISAALESGESPDFPALVAFGFSLSEIALDKDETDLAANATFRKLPRIDLT